ncbi:MAG: hypothetical protein OXL37_07810 [Chloroflexota bacterium]|nr:hypothetical protein [Chloroflexota bacterium]MDE2960298.1 hypothetical protein [Chloroflexota bacterium]
MAAQSPEQPGSADGQMDDTRYQGNLLLARVSLVVVGGVLLALLALVLVMAFFGDARQSDLALSMLTVGGQALGGGGFVLLVAFGINRLIRR